MIVTGKLSRFFDEKSKEPPSSWCLLGGIFFYLCKPKYIVSIRPAIVTISDKSSMFVILSPPAYVLSGKYF